MGQYFSLTGRNVKIYLRDKGAIFFSLLSMVIVIALMVLFLGDMTIDAVLEILGQFPGRDAAVDKENATLFVFAWTSGGILSINAVTVTLATYSAMIKDRVAGKLNSFFTAPISRTIIAASYITSAWIASVLVCAATFVILEIYGVANGMEVYSFVEHAKVLLMIMVNSFLYASIMYLLAVFSKTEAAWSGLGTVVGTLVGFLGGIYIPIGSLSEGIGLAMKCTPIIYGCSMFREVMTKTILETTFKGVPKEAQTEIFKQLKEKLGITLSVSGHTCTLQEELLIIAILGICFLLLSTFVLKYSKKTDR